MAEELHLNERAYGILEELRPHVQVTDYGGIRLLDLGVNQSLDKETELGIKVAKASTGDLANIEIIEDVLHIQIDKDPAIATLGCQLAGWSIKINGKDGLGSGPARIPAKRPRVFVDKLNYIESSEKVALVLETDLLPNEEVLREVLAKTCGNELIVAAFRGDSNVGGINILSRVVEMAFFRLDHLGFDTLKIEKASGDVTLPKSQDVFDLNDAIRYNGSVTIETRGWDPTLTEKTVSASSRSYERGFREIFDETGNFYDIDPDVFTPAELNVVDLDTGKEYHAGKRIPEEKV